MGDNRFIISEEDWSIHWKGYSDQKRHQDKIKSVLKKKLPDLISEEDMILSKGKNIIRIPIRFMNEYKIRYNQEKNKYIGQGDGNSKVGDAIAKSRYIHQETETGEGAGDKSGKDYYEAEISFKEVEEAFLSQLKLPNLIEKEKDNIKTKTTKFNDIRKKGLQGNIDKKRTLLEAYRRNAIRGQSSFFPVYLEDIRYKTWNTVENPESKAVVLAMMDTSGSMGDFEKYIARSFFFWMTQFLQSNYETVEIAFIAHHTEANVVDEASFFSKGQSGGTICSSAYRKAIELIDERYDPNRYNIYTFHVSDGDNLISDNRRCEHLVKALLEYSSLFGYVEVNQYQRHSTLMRLFKERNEANFDSYTIKKKSDVYYAMQHFFSAKKHDI
ncbi:sporulation protein YhbH [Paraliobacillus sp. JSM ZJ581]|uniref:sporulation protein YhbH n=1 Tax=Paraliobacillus sp. JSM ZJ581 TaxID=3342118 RepID=UPI0035A83B16